MSEGQSPRLDARPISILVASHLALLWVLASAVSRGQGFWFFVMGIAGLVVTLLALRQGRRSIVFAIYAITMASTLSALALEILLHAVPELLPGPIANVSYTGYHWQKGGIYTLDRHLGPDLKPDVHRDNYWQGHWWRHDTNENGYRRHASTGRARRR